MMNKYVSFVLVALLSQSTLSAMQVKKNKVDTIKSNQESTIKSISNKDILQKVSELKITKLHHFTPKQVLDGGSTYLIKGTFTLPDKTISSIMNVTKDFKTVIYGQAFNAENGQPYSQFTEDELREASGFTYGTGPTEVLIFTDPLCPYCKNLEKELSKYKNYITAHIILIALPMHKEAPDAIRYVLNKKNDTERYEALIEIANGKTSFKEETYDEKTLNRLNKKWEQMEGYAKDLKVTGTPSLYDIKGIPMDMQFFGMLDQNIDVQLDAGERGHNEARAE